MNVIEEKTIKNKTFLCKNYKEKLILGPLSYIIVHYRIIYLTVPNSNIYVRKQQLQYNQVCIHQ